MAKHNCEDLKPTDAPSMVPTFTKASSDCALNQICAQNLFSSQVSQDTSSTSMVSPCPNSGEHLLMESAGETREEDYAVNWLKFVSSMSSKTVMTGSSITEPTPAHVVYSPLASMNHQWTINLCDGYPHFYVLIPGESIPPSLLPPPPPPPPPANVV